MISSSGSVLLSEAGRKLMRNHLFKRAAIVCPNLPEINYFLNKNFSNLVDAAKDFFDEFKTPVYLKGGHCDQNQAVDVLCTLEGVWVLETENIKEPKALHGTGCRLSAAICANLASGEDLLTSSLKAKAYMQACLSSPCWVNTYTPRHILSYIDSYDVTQVKCTKLD
jgi:hydroxymethylpyrimidine/phosphomethylpyrimidine kinase